MAMIIVMIAVAYLDLGMRGKIRNSFVSVEGSSTVSQISSAATTEPETATTGDLSSDTTISSSSATSTDLETTTDFLASSDTTAGSDVTVTTTASTDLSTDTATLTSGDETTTETMITKLSSTYNGETATTLLGSDTTILAETTKTVLDETTTTAAAPIETSFQILADDKGPLMGMPVDFWEQLSFLHPTSPTLDFTIEPATSFVVTNTNSLYIHSRPLDVVFSQFYLEPQSVGFGLLLGSKDHNPAGSFTTVDLETT
ncbi:hypothetical protein FIE12Z_9523 [Fusarium flagelliforme]|uniref:Uncharacterized protein n=1 Tax=Fusarium flagelliforme TaxID=2675880 RepID=A0A395MEF1_9HYPO|nr:hypothetical protein FIE12Z_9523 [Fusarium flagelliforme]